MLEFAVFTEDETPLFRENGKAQFSDLALTIQSTKWQLHIKDPSVTNQSPFRRLSVIFTFLFPVCN